MKKKIAILGSTGSIGKTLINILKKDKKNFEIVLLTSNTNYRELLKQVKLFDVKNIIISDYKSFLYVKKELNNNKIYHHLGCYIFTKESLSKFVKLPRSNLEIERNLEQMRALENDIVIKVGLSDSMPLSVDTENDLIKVTKEMN